MGGEGVSGRRGRERPGVSPGPGQGARRFLFSRLGVASPGPEIQRGPGSSQDGAGVPGVPSRPHRRPPPYLCPAPHRRSRAARTRARRRRARRAASGAAAAAAPGGRACCSRRPPEGRAGPAPAASRPPPPRPPSAAAAWASATTARVSPAATGRRLAAPSRRPPRAGTHEASRGRSGPEGAQRRGGGGAGGRAAGAGPGEGRGQRGGGAGPAPPGLPRSQMRARSRPAGPLPRGSRGTPPNGDSPPPLARPRPPPPPRLSGSVAPVRVGSALGRPHPGIPEVPSAMSEAAGRPRGPRTRSGVVDGGTRSTLSFIHPFTPSFKSGQT